MTDVTCVRGKIEMTKRQWFSLPQALRERYWRETKYGEKEPSESLCAEVKAALEETRK